MLDDFGTGYSSLAYVRRFPIEVLKVDRSFVMDLAREGHDTTIVEAVINMARGLRIEVVAEGVETEEQAALLRDLGCELARGFPLLAPSRRPRPNGVRPRRRRRRRAGSERGARCGTRR